MVSENKIVRSKTSDVYKVPHDMMTTSGVWPEENPSVYYRIKTFFSWFSAIGLLVVQAIDAIDCISDSAKLAKIAYIMITIATFNVKLGIFFIRRQKFLDTIKFLQDPVFSSYPNEIDDYLKKNIKNTGQIASTLKYFFMSIASIYSIFPIIDGKSLPFPFPYELGIYTPLMYGFQITAEAYAAWNNASIDRLCACMLGVAVAQLELLTEKIVFFTGNDVQSQNLETSEKLDRETKAKVKQFVEHHLAIIKHVDSVEDVFSTGLFLQFMTSAMTTFSAKFLLLVDYTIAMIIELFIYCWFGNKIILKSTQIGIACYNFGWYFYNKEICKSLFIIMERCKRPLKITTMRFSVLSLASFMSILQWTYSCLALLLSMYYKH